MTTPTRREYQAAIALAFWGLFGDDNGESSGLPELGILEDIAVAQNGEKGDRDPEWLNFIGENIELERTPEGVRIDFEGIEQVFSRDEVADDEVARAPEDLDRVDLRGAALDADDYVPANKPIGDENDKVERGNYEEVAADNVDAGQLTDDLDANENEITNASKLSTEDTRITAKFRWAHSSPLAKLSEYELA